MHNLGRTCWLVDGFEEVVVVVGVTFIKLYLERSLFGETAFNRGYKSFQSFSLVLMLFLEKVTHILTVMDRNVVEKRVQNFPLKCT